MNLNKDTLREFLRGSKAALPIVVGYIALGIPAGILGAAAGMNTLMCALLAIFMYSGSGQYMIPNMYLAASNLASLCLSTNLVSSRQMLYGSALSPHFKNESKFRVFYFAATVTDESFGVNTQRFKEGDWSTLAAQGVNSTSHLSWILSCISGSLLGNWLVIDTAIASFAMTSIFLCLLLMQKLDAEHTAAMLCAVLGVVICKVLGIAGISILVAAILGVLGGMTVAKLKARKQ